MYQQQQAGLQLSHTLDGRHVWPHLGVELPVLRGQQHAILALADQQVFGDEVTAGKGWKVSRAASSRVQQQPGLSAAESHNKGNSSLSGGKVTCRSSSSCSNSASESLFPAQQGSTQRHLQPGMSCSCHRSTGSSCRQHVQTCAAMCRMICKPCSATERGRLSCQAATSWMEMVCLLFRVIVSFLSSLVTALGSVTLDLTCSWVSTPMSRRISDRPA